MRSFLVLFFTEGVINILAIAALVQDDNQEMALVWVRVEPSGKGDKQC